MAVLNDLYVYVCVCAHTETCIKKKIQTPHLEVEVDHLLHEVSCLFKNSLFSTMRINFHLNLFYKTQVKINGKSI